VAYWSVGYQLDCGWGSRNCANCQAKNQESECNGVMSFVQYPGTPHAMRDEFYLISEVAREHPSSPLCFSKMEVFLISFQKKARRL
jgi:hypothetical protein